MNEKVDKKLKKFFEALDGFDDELVKSINEFVNEIDRDAYKQGQQDALKKVEELISFDGSVSIINETDFWKLKERVKEGEDGM